METKKEKLVSKNTRFSTGAIIGIIVTIVGFFALGIVSIIYWEPKTLNSNQSSLLPSLPSTATPSSPLIQNPTPIKPSLSEISQADQTRIREIITSNVKNSFPATKEIMKEIISIFVKYNATDEEITNYIKKIQLDVEQNESNQNNTLQEKTTADVIAEWTPRVVLTVCMWIDPNSGKLIEAGRGSGTLNYFNSNDGFNIITNRHVLVYKESGPSLCNVLFPWDKNFDIYNKNDNFKMGTEEDYGFIKLPNDSFLSKFPTNSFKKCSLDSVNIGDKLVILGFPAIGSDSGITATDGIVSGIEQNYFVTSAKIDGGNSGGAAILLKDDCYLGIPSASMVGRIESLGRILKWSFAIN